MTICCNDQNTSGVQICKGSPNQLAYKDPHRSIFASGFGLGDPFWGGSKSAGTPGLLYYLYMPEGLGVYTLGTSIK
jgi:hypothetical protein